VNILNSLICSITSTKNNNSSIVPMRLKTIGAAALAALGMQVGECYGDITGVTGAVVNNGQLTSGQNLNLGQTQSSTEIRAYHESVVTLGSALAVDRIGTAFTTSGNIAGGTTVETYLLHADPPGSTPTLFSGSITFDTPILGLIFSDSRLNGTDSSLGVSGVTYYNGASRGLELGSDSFTISGNTLTFSGQFNASTAVDEIRILTAAVPEPTTIFAGALVLIPLAASTLRSLRGRCCVS